MKNPVGYAQPKRLAGKKKQVRLNLRRSKPAPDPEQDLDSRQTSHFWRWFIVVALLHVAAIIAAVWIYSRTPAPQPPEQFISLLPEGQTVKGTPGTQAAPKIGLATPAPSSQAAPPVAVKPPPVPVPVKPKPVIIKPDAPDVAAIKPPPPKPAVKLTKADLNLADAPSPDKPVKSKTHPKKKTTVATNADPSSPDTTGLSKEEIAAKLGQKLEQAGAVNQTAVGQDGSDHSQANQYQDFYRMIHDQVMGQWHHPNLVDETAVNPVVKIHVEKDGRVPPELVTLEQSSGNPDYDQSALDAARGLGYLLQPLPDGCPPDISINFKLTR